MPYKKALQWFEIAPEILTCYLLTVRACVRACERACLATTSHVILKCHPFAARKEYCARFAKLFCTRAWFQMSARRAWSWTTFIIYVVFVCALCLLIMWSLFPKCNCKCNESGPNFLPKKRTFFQSCNCKLADLARLWPSSLCQISFWPWHMTYGCSC